MFDLGSDEHLWYITMHVNHAERFPNTFKRFILEKVNREQKEALRVAIGEQVQTIDHQFPTGVPLTFFGDDQHGFVSLEYTPLSETADPHVAGIHFGIYPRSLSQEEENKHVVLKRYVYHSLMKRLCDSL